MLFRSSSSSSCDKNMDTRSEEVMLVESSKFKNKNLIDENVLSEKLTDKDTSLFKNNNVSMSSKNANFSINQVKSSGVNAVSFTLNKKLNPAATTTTTHTTTATSNGVQVDKSQARTFVSNSNSSDVASSSNNTKVNQPITTEL